MKPIKCPNCRERAIQVTRENYTTSLDHDGRAYDLTVPNLPVLVCAKCGYRTLDREANEMLSAQLRTSAGLLQPQEIRSRREALTINQKTLAEHLGIAPATLSRWETGSQIQQRGYDTILRLYFDMADVRRYLTRRTTGQLPPTCGSTTTSQEAVASTFSVPSHSSTPRYPKIAAVESQAVR